MIPVSSTEHALGAMPARKPRILLAGEFSAGKTRLISGLLGEAALPSNVTATALPPVWVINGNPMVLSVPRDGITHEITKVTRLDADTTRYGIVAHPAPILQHLDLIDTPGTSDPNMPAEAWRRMLDFTDAVVWCTNATQAWRQSEKAIWQEMPETLRETATLVITHADRLTGEVEADRVLRRVMREAGRYFAHVLMVSLIAPEDVEVVRDHLLGLARDLPALPGAENALIEAAALKARLRAERPARPAPTRPIAVRSIKVDSAKATPRDATRPDAMAPDATAPDAIAPEVTPASTAPAGTAPDDATSAQTAPPESARPESMCPAPEAPAPGLAASRRPEPDLPEPDLPRPDFSNAFRVVPAPKADPKADPQPVASAARIAPATTTPRGRARDLWDRLGGACEDDSPAEILSRVEQLIALLDGEEGLAPLPLLPVPPAPVAPAPPARAEAVTVADAEAEDEDDAEAEDNVAEEDILTLLGNIFDTAGQDADEDGLARASDPAPAPSRRPDADSAADTPLRLTSRLYPRGDQS